MGDKKSFKRQTEIFRLKEGSLGYFFKIIIFKINIFFNSQVK